MTSVELEQVALAVEEQPELLMPITGELIDLRQPGQVAGALDEVRDLVRRLGELRRTLEAVLRLEGQRQGTKTLHLGGYQATISGGEQIEWDLDRLRTGLTQAGLPEDRLARLIVEEISYKVDGRIARQLIGANPDYAAAIANARTILPAPWRVTIKRET